VKLFIDKSFEKDLKKLNNRDLNLRIASILEQIQEANSLEEISNTKRLKGNTMFYRIRVGMYRLGLEYQDGTVTMIRCLHRKEVYRYFPK
jgi:mRNA interferase RelE/StbE